MATTESKKRSVNLAWLAVLALVFVASAFAQDEPIVEQPLSDEELQMPGTVEGTGTYFEVTDSEYLNIVLASSEPVNLRLESVPEMVVMDIEAAEGATSTEITLSGFAPSTTYYKYEDDYHNEVAFTTDGGGTYIYTQDLTIPHLIFIQQQAGTIFLSDSGWSDPTVGTWDDVTMTGTLTTDVYDTIQIDSDGITLDGNSHTVTVTGYTRGVNLYNRNSITIKNLNVKTCWVGISIHSSNYGTLTDNTFSNNSYGIALYNSSDNTLTDNTVSSNSQSGISLGDSSGNTITGNTISNNRYGIRLSGSSNNNTLTGNTLNSNYWRGIYLDRCNGNTLSGNTLLSNYYGIYLYSASDNTLAGNTLNSNSIYGVFLYSASSNTLTGNTALNNSCAISLHQSSDNTLTDNTLSSNNSGVFLSYSSTNSLTDNSASNNIGGVYLFSASSNTLARNTLNSNSSSGVYLYGNSNNNDIYNNNFIDNSKPPYVSSDSIGNIFNLDRPIGGNYWSEWTTPDADGDGFVDYWYVFTGGHDELPWTKQDGWLNQAPIADAGDDQTVEAESPQGTEVILDGSDSTDPDSTPGTNDDIVSFDWYEGDTLLGSGETINYTFGLGSHTVTLVVTDSAGETDDDEVIITVVDTTPPEIFISAPELYGLYPVGGLVLGFSAYDLVSGNIEPPYLQATLSDATGYSVPVEPGDVVVAAGVYTLLVEATDDTGNASESEVFFVVYDPEGGFVTGGGWISSPEGAYKPDPSLTGKANFGFVSKYKKGTTVPTGNTEFVFKTGDLNFHSNSYEWLVVNQAGTNAQFKGSGTINNAMAPNDEYYRFMLWAGDGEPDTFRIKIWWEDGDTENVVYDNGFNQEIGGGSIVIHKN